MTRAVSLAGQWKGFFEYGPGYGEGMHGEKVQFRLFLQDTLDGQFKGTSVDIEGVGANFDEAIIEGFVEDVFISFTKEYEKYFLIDEAGNKIYNDSNLSPRLSYYGEYYETTKIFRGWWEIWHNEKTFGSGTLVDIGKGVWEMTKDISV